MQLSERYFLFRYYFYLLTRNRLQTVGRQHIPNVLLTAFTRDELTRMRRDGSYLGPLFPAAHRLLV
jgi:hypothetical protein